MNSFDDTRRQLRIALIALAFIIPFGTIGFHIIEAMSWQQSLWLTIITLGTVGYGDVVPNTAAGQLFTILLIVFGLGTVAYAAQAAVVFLVSPNIRIIRQRRRADRKIREMRNHYIICGEGELVNKTISYLRNRAEHRREHQREALEAMIHHRMTWLPGDIEDHSTLAAFKRQFSRILMWLALQLNRGQTLLDVLVVITKDVDYALHLQEQGLLVIEDDPTDDSVLLRAGVEHAQAIMAMLESDSENMLTVLTVRDRNPGIYITAAIEDDSLQMKMTRIGANNVLAPYEAAGQFLNNATLRPAVNDFFSSILFDERAKYQMVQIYLSDASPWIGTSIPSHKLRERFDTALIGVRKEQGNYLYAPPESYIMREGDVLLFITPGPNISQLQAECCGGSIDGSRGPIWQQLPHHRVSMSSDRTYSLIEAEDAIKDMSRHYIICGSGPVARAALDKLDPTRPFVVLSNDGAHISEMLSRGFRVINGDPTHDSTLLRAGVDRALAIMIAMEDKAANMMTTLNSRTLNRNILITVTANTDEMVPKLRRAGADRVVSPYRIAAQTVVLATTRPIVSDFLQHVLFNYLDRIETTELYMQHNSPWKGRRIRELDLEGRFNAGAIGVRQTSGQFVYAPSGDYILQEGEVLIVITSMDSSDQLRLVAHGGISLRPDSLRS
jgi:voltage-gated potassium channel